MSSTYHIITFGCQANLADSERMAASLQARGMVHTDNQEDADQIVINTCMVRQMAEDRVYGLYNNLIKQKRLTGKPGKIVITGCMVGAALRDPKGDYINQIRSRMPEVDEFLPIEEVGFDNAPLRTDDHHAWIPISNGCNNFCTFCIVPFTRGREISRPFEDIIHECEHLAKHGYTSITLIGQNVNSYGADLILGKDNIQVLRDVKGVGKFFPDTQHTSSSAKHTPLSKAEEPSQEGSRVSSQEENNKLPSREGPPTFTSGWVCSKFEIKSKPTYVKHLGRYRIPTLFPHLLETICTKFPEFTNVEFISSNPWDFSDDLINTIAKYPQINRKIHLPIQAGSDRILKKMNRWYTAKQYIDLTNKIKTAIPEVEFSTDIIVGFPGETDDDFKQTLQLIKQVKFYKAYIARYSPRPHTAATTALPDNVPHAIKKKRWKKLDGLINH